MDRTAAGQRGKATARELIHLQSWRLVTRDAFKVTWATDFSERASKLRLGSCNEFSVTLMAPAVSRVQSVQCYKRWGLKLNSVNLNFTPGTKTSPCHLGVAATQSSTQERVPGLRAKSKESLSVDTH